MKGERKKFAAEWFRRRDPSGPNLALKLWGACLCASFFPCFPLLSAPAIDESKLPPPATNQVDFARDIKPILDASCLRCHGSEKPKSHFRLDNRADALKGGDEGTDIIPGNSAKSPLIHYVSHLVEDMEMPPLGKGDQLSAKQIGLLRAWIDQGVIWEEAPPTNVTLLDVSLLAGATGVSGDSHKFRELYWQKDGANGGIEYFELIDRSVPGTKFSIAGHALLNDYKVTLSLEKNEIGFVHSGWEQYRKYYDDTGGYRPQPITPTALSLNRDLHLDIGKAWVDFGLTLPHLPQMVLGYEYDYRKGDEAITSWGAAGQFGNFISIAPASKNIQEGVHIIKFDLDDEVKGVTIQERFRGEFYHLDTTQTNQAARSLVANNTSDGNRYFQGANTIRFEKQFNGWLFGSAGYLYSKLNSDASFADTVTFANVLSFVSQVPRITLERESHVVNLNGLLGPFDKLTISLGVQSEWTHENGFGSGILNEIPYTESAPGTLAVNPAVLNSDYQESTVTESLALRYTRIPFTVLFAEGRLRQQSIGQTDSDLQPSGNFQENPSFSSQLSDLRTGFTTSPWRSVSLTAHYRRYENDSFYKTNQNPQPVNGYPGFIQSRDLVTDEAEVKLVLHPCTWFKPSLSYQYLTTRYRETTATAFDPNLGIVASPGGPILAGQTDSRIYSIGATWLPSRRLFLDTTFSYQTSRTITENNGTAFIAPYRGDIYTALANGTYVLDQYSDLSLGYLFSEANYGQTDFASVVPVGITYKMHAAQMGLAHRFNENVSGKLQYRFSYYNEPTSGGVANFRAHTLFASMTFRLR